MYHRQPMEASDPSTLAMHGMMQVKLSVSQKLNILSAVPPLRCQQPSKPSSLAVGRSKPCDARQGRHRVEGFQNYEKSSFVRRHQRDVIPFRWQRLHRRWQIRNGANGAASPCVRRVVMSQRSYVIHQSTTAIWTAAARCCATAGDTSGMWRCCMLHAAEKSGHVRSIRTEEKHPYVRIYHVEPLEYAGPITRRGSARGQYMLLSISVRVCVLYSVFCTP